MTDEVIEEVESGKLEVLKNIKKRFGYELLALEEDYAKVLVDLDKVQTLDESDTVFEAEIYKAANFSALASINEKGYFVVSAYIDFLSQIDVNSKSIYFEANALHNSLGKRQVEVKGFIDDIAVFQGDFSVLKLDHRSNIKLKA